MTLMKFMTCRDGDGDGDGDGDNDGDSLTKAQPFLLNEDFKASNCSIIGIDHKHSHRSKLRGSIPSIYTSIGDGQGDGDGDGDGDVLIPEQCTSTETA